MKREVRRLEDSFLEDIHVIHEHQKSPMVIKLKGNKSNKSREPVRRIKEMVKVAD